MSDPLPNPPLSPAEDGGTNLSTGFLALMGAIAGGSPQLVIPTSTVVELIGNTVMGAIVVAVLDKMLVRQTLQGKALRTGRMLLLLFVSVTLTIVTYKPSSIVFQTVFDTAPTRQIQQLSAATFTNQRLGNIGYRLTFVTEPNGLTPVFERMETLKGAEYQEFEPGQDWNSFLDKHLPGEAFSQVARTFKSPTGYAWITTSPTDPSRKSRTVLIYDRESGRAFVLHTAG